MERFFSVRKETSGINKPASFVLEEFVWGNGENPRLVLFLTSHKGRSAFSLGMKVAEVLEEGDKFIPSYRGMGSKDMNQFISGVNFQKK